MIAITAFALAAVATYALRSCMTLSGFRISESPTAARAIGLVSPAVLAAIVVSSLLLDSGQLIRPDLAELLAAAAALGLVHRTGNVSLALFAGLPVFWVASLLPL